MGKCLFVAMEGVIGLGPEALRVNDILRALCGGPRIYVLRPNAGRYQLVGEAYVPMLFPGVAPQRWRKGELKMQDFELR